MNVLTTESKRHREIEDQKDLRTSSIIGAAIEVHRRIGPMSGKRVGLLINFNNPLLTQKIIRRIL